MLYIMMKYILLFADHSFTFQVETYFEVSPGLSAYAFTPSMVGAAYYLEHML